MTRSVVNHLRWVEHSWIEHRLVDGPDLGPWTDEIIARHQLDDLSATPLRSGVRPTLGWVLLHLVEENARHNGHLDLLRELADGTTGQ